MPNGMMPPEKFEEIKEDKLKIDTLYLLVYELYKRKRYDSLKTITGGFMGGFAAMAAKFAIWR